MIASFALVLVVLVVLRVRKARRRTLAGLNHDRPVFHVDPPQRRLGARHRERL